MPNQIVRKSACSRKHEDAEEEFDREFNPLVRDVAESPEYAEMNFTNEWLNKMLNYNVPFGKKTRWVKPL